MTYMPVTAFRRPIDAVQISQRANARAPLPDHAVNKWEVLRSLGIARKKLGLSDRALVVLQALISFFPGTDLNDGSDLVVFPSNASIRERLNGMPYSTMRRHLASLVEAGIIARRDSPNGKRYARNGDAGREAFGFDLSPLPRRHLELSALAESVRAEAEAHDRLRRTVSLMRRDLAGLATYGAETCPQPLWQRLSDLAKRTAHVLRRVLSLDDLKVMEAELLDGLNKARGVLEPTQSLEFDAEMAGEMSTSGSQSEHHHQTSHKEDLDLELCLEEGAASGEPPSNIEAVHQPPRLPLPLVRSACPALSTYSQRPIRHWHDVVSAADVVRPMMGISPSAWSEAQDAMGPENAAIVVAALLERFSSLRSPGGYLRALTAKAAAGAFSPGPMVMALLRSDGSQLGKSSQL